MAFSKVEENALPSISKKYFCFRLKKKKEKSTLRKHELASLYDSVQALKGVHLDPLKSLNGQNRTRALQSCCVSKVLLIFQKFVINPVRSS